MSFVACATLLHRARGRRSGHIAAAATMRRARARR